LTLGVYNVRAVVFEKVGKAPEIQEVTLEAPRAGEVKVKISGAGVCGSDLHVQRGEWELPMPLVMGHEGSGIVVELGEGVPLLRSVTMWCCHGSRPVVNASTAN